MAKLVILWTAPRSISSAVYQAMTTLQQTRVKCYFELYMYPYVFGSQGSQGQSPVESLPIQPTYSAVNGALLQDHSEYDVVFSKEMAKCLPAKGSSEFEKTLKELAHAKHMFLIRDPAKVVYSRFKVNQKKPTGYETYSEIDAGLMELYDLYYYVQANFDNDPTVLDASDIQNDPSAAMKLLCEAISIPFEPHMTNWDAGQVDIKMPIGDWYKYFETLQSSSGFITVPYSEQKEVPMEELTPEMIKYIEECRPHYEILKAKCKYM